MRIGNYAESPPGAVYIKNFNITFDYDAKTISKLDLPMGRTLEETFKITTVPGNMSMPGSQGAQPASKLPKSYLFKNERQSYIEFDVAFRHDEIVKIPDDISTLKCSVSFDYLEYTKEFKGNELEQAFATQSQRCGFDVQFKIEVNPGRYWLAVDLGTSAIVAAFDKEVSADRSLLNLQRKHQVYIDKDFPGRKYYTSHYISEFQTNFLSSKVLLHSGGALDAVQRRDDIVYLAPPIAVEGQIGYIAIPYLKSLIGAKKLPHLDVSYDKFQYKATKDDQDVDLIDNPLEISAILKNVYRRLFEDYIIPMAGSNDKDKQLNKVILTVPNTFTPRHIDSLRGLILSRFGKDVQRRLCPVHQ